MSVQHKDWYTSTDVGVRIENSNGPVVTSDEVAVEITGNQAHKSFKSLTDALEEKVDVGAAVTSVEYDGTAKKIVAYKETTPTDVVTIATIKTDLNLAKGDVGLGNVDNTSDANKPISTATQTALDAKVAQTAFDGHVNDTDNPHQVTAAQVGLGNADNTPDAEKDVNSAVKDGDGNVITETYETIAQAGASHTTLQGNIDAVSAIVQNLTGLEGTNFGGFSLDAVEATAISNIATIYTNAGYTSGDLYWFLAGTDMSALKAYRYDGSGSPVAISSTVYDFTDFSGLSDKVQDYKGTITTLTAFDALNTAASAGIYYIKTSQFNGIVLVESFYDGLATTVSQQLIGSGTPVSSGGAYTVEKGQTLVRRTYSGSAWSEWSNPIASMQSQIDQLGPKIDQLYKEESIEEYTLDDGAEISFDTITLSQDGDFVEFDLVCNVQSTRRGHGFCGYGSQFAIGLYQQQVGLRSESNENINGFDFTNGQHTFTSQVDRILDTRGTLKIAYEDGQVSAYVNGTKVNTSAYSTTTRPSIKINHIGKYTSSGTDYYWRGTIYGFSAKCGSTTYSKLSDIPNFSANSSVVIVSEHTETGKIADIKESVDELDERVTELEGIDHSHNVSYTEESSEEQGTITAASIGTSGFVQHAYVTQTSLTSNYNQYDTYWFIADKAMKIWVSKTGGSGSFFRLLVGDGTLQSHTATSYASTTPPTSLSEAYDVAVGQLVALSVLTDKTSWTIANQYQKTDKVIEGYKIAAVTDLQERVQVLENKSGLPIAVIPVSSTQFQVQTTNRQGKVLIYKWELHNYSKTINNESVLCGNVWNQSMIYDSNNQQVIQGNNNFIFAIDGEASGFEDEHKNFHAGPGHGCEVAKFTLFLADGEVIDPTTLSEPIYCSTFRATHSSEVYAVDATTSTAQSTGNSNNYPKVDANNVPIVAALHYLDWELREENSIKEYNRLIIKRNGTVFNQLHCAMLQCYVPRFTDILINDNAQSWVEVDSAEAGSNYIQHSAKSGTDFIWSPRLATRAIAYGNNIAVRQDVVSLLPNREGKMYIYTVPYNDRFKCYYMPAITTTSSQSAYETFNDGDSFEMEIHRKIEVRQAYPFEP